MKNPRKMHIDINSCFATLEQQANPLLRYRPVAVAARDTKYATIVAASYEAKRLGIGVGTKVSDAKSLCPKIVILTPDPPKYRDAHSKIYKLLLKYTDQVYPKSIDEFLLDFTSFEHLDLLKIGQEIKDSIKKYVGDYISTSVGIGPNRFLAKTASNLKKPDGLCQIDDSNFLQVYKTLELKDLHGINQGFASRLASVGIFNVESFYYADPPTLKKAFRSINYYQWYLRLRGYETDNTEFARKSFSNSYVLPHTTRNISEISALLMKLVFRTTDRMRAHGFKTKGIHVGILFKDKTFWHKGKILTHELYTTSDIYQQIIRTLYSCPDFGKKEIKQLSESCFYLIKDTSQQLGLFEDTAKKELLTKSVDKLNAKLGEFTVVPATMLHTKDHAKDTIAFGNAT